jgi:hypothetical protein
VPVRPNGLRLFRHKLQLAAFFLPKTLRSTATETPQSSAEKLAGGTVNFAGRLSVYYTNGKPILKIDKKLERSSQKEFNARFI